MVDIRPKDLPPAILPLRTGDAVVVDQGADGVRQTNPISFTDSVAPVASQAEAVAGADNAKRMTALRTKQSIASEVGVTLASNAQGAKADSAVQSVNGKTGNTITITKADVGLGNVDNTSDANKPISTATQAALDAKANSSVTISAGTGLTGGGNLTTNRTVSLNAASIASLAKADSAVQTVNGVSPISGNVTVAAEEKRLQDTRATAIAESFPSNVLFVETAGYYSPGDGGGALYKKVSSEPSHMGKFQSADGAWWELYEQMISVRAFGAKGDAISDDSQYFYRAYDYLKSKGGGTVLIPATAQGLNYAFFNPVYIDTLADVAFQGIGNPYLMSYMNAGQTMFNIGTGTTITQRSIVFNDLRIFGDSSSATGTAIYVFYCTTFRMNRVTIYNHKGRGLSADNCYALYLNDCNITGNGEGNVYLSGASGNGALFTHCTFNNAPVGKFSVHIDGTSGAPHYGTTFQSCMIEFNDIGIMATYVHAINLKGCYFEFNTGNHFRIVDCKGVSIDGNSLFSGAGFIGTSDGVKIVSNCGEVGASIYASSSTGVNIDVNSGPASWITQGP